MHRLVITSTQLGAFMVESPLGRRWSLAGSTFVTAFFCVMFVMADASWAIRTSAVGISLSATVGLRISLQMTWLRL